MTSGEGGAAAILGGGEGAGGEGGAPADGGGVVDNGGGEGAGAGGGGEGGGATWFDGFNLSAEAPDANTLSDRDWLANKKFADPAALISAYRGLERQMGAGGKIELPKDGDPAEKVDAFYKAIGRPDNAEGYEVKLPDGVEGAIDEALLGSFREAAFKAGLPKGMAESLAGWYVQQQLDQDAAIVAARDQEAQATLKEWGAQKDANIALANRAAQHLGLSSTDIADIQRGFGAGRTMELLRKLGGGMAEDVLLTGGGRQRFGVTGVEARAQLDAMNADPDLMAKLAKGDQTVIARRDRLIEALAAEEDRKGREAA